jgi:hypothetical protein
MASLFPNDLPPQAARLVPKLRALADKGIYFGTSAVGARNTFGRGVVFKVIFAMSSLQIHAALSIAARHQKW